MKAFLRKIFDWLKLNSRIFILYLLYIVSMVIFTMLLCFATNVPLDQFFPALFLVFSTEVVSRRFIWPTITKIINRLYPGDTEETKKEEK